MPNIHLTLAEKIAARYSTLENVQAVALAGSSVSGFAQAGSDIDVYVYTRTPISMIERDQVAYVESQRREVNDFWGPGDVWIDSATGIEVDVIYWTMDWIEEQLERTLIRCEAWTGYTTAFWYTVRHSQSLFDRSGWFYALQQHANQPYPAALVRNIIANNYPLLRERLPSYTHQIEKALTRNDLVSVNHRVAAFLASYFDILFAINRQPHPGEKRLLERVERDCLKRPPELRAQVEALIHVSGQNDTVVLELLDALVAGLEALLAAEGLL